MSYERQQALRRMAWGPWISILVLVVLVGSAIFLWRHLGSRETSKGTMPLFEVVQGPLTISVMEAGTIQPREQVILKSEVEGSTTILYLIPEGTLVEKGELLVQLDKSQLEDARVDQEIRVQNGEAAFLGSREGLEVVKNQTQSNIDQAELNFRFAKQDLLKYQEGEYLNKIKELEAQITLAEEELRRNEERLKWSRILFQEKYLSESELKADELSANKAQLDLELSRSNQALYLNYTHKRTLDELESDVKQTEMALERVQRNAKADLVQAEVELRAKEAEYNRQKDKLSKIIEQIEKTEIFAPTDGLVIYATSAKMSSPWRQSEPLSEGQTVREREELIYLPTANTFKADIKIHESQLDKVKVGLPVRVTVDALPGEAFRGVVVNMAPLPDSQSMFMNPDLKVYNTEIHIERGRELLRTGMTCKAEVIIEEYENAIYVPVQSVLRVGGEPTVYFPGERWPIPRPVKIGLNNNRMVRILDGLRPGEKVLLAPPLQEGVVQANGQATDEIEDREMGMERNVELDDRNEKPMDRSDSSMEEVTPERKTAAEREAMREHWEKMSPEDREAFKASRGSGGREGGPGSERGSGRRERPAGEPGERSQ